MQFPYPRSYFTPNSQILAVQCHTFSYLTTPRIENLHVRTDLKPLLMTPYAVLYLLPRSKHVLSFRLPRLGCIARQLTVVECCIDLLTGIRSNMTAPPSVDGEDTRPLPDGWIAEMDPSTRRIYYVGL